MAKLEIDNCEGYTFTAKSPTGHEVLQHQRDMEEAVTFIDIIALRVNDLVEAVYDPKGTKVDDPMSLPWDGVVVHLALAAARTLLPKVLTDGSGTEKTED